MSSGRATATAGSAHAKASPPTPETAVSAFADALTEANLEAATACFTREGTLITPDGTAVQGRTDIRGVLVQLIAMNPRIESQMRRVTHAGEVALVRERWRIGFAAAQDKAEAFDAGFVARRLESGWKLSIAAPWGWGR